MNYSGYPKLLNPPPFDRHYHTAYKNTLVVCEYIKPDNPYTTPIPTKPREPTPSDIQEGATQARELTTINDDKLQRLLSHFDRELAKYGVIQRGLN